MCLDGVGRTKVPPPVGTTAVSPLHLSSPKDCFDVGYLGRWGFRRAGGPEDETLASKRLKCSGERSRKGHVRQVLQEEL